MGMSKGFTLSEVMLSLLILSSTMFILSELQVKSMIKVWYGREEIDRLYLIKKYAYKAFMYPEKVKKKEVLTSEEPLTQIEVEKGQISKKSSLAPFKKFLSRVESRGSWDRISGKKEVRMIGFALRDENAGGDDE